MIADSPAWRTSSTTLSSRLSAYISLVLLLLPAFSNAQYYWVQFQDKNNSPYSVDRPSEFLSLKSIGRRARQGIAVNATDFPVNPEYRAQILNQDNVKLHHASKWLNGLAVESSDSNSIKAIIDLPFVREVKALYIPLDGKKLQTFQSNKFEDDELTVPFQYGLAQGQIEMFNLQALHSKGLYGEGIWIGVFDSGFNLVDTIDHFDHLYKEERLVSQHDFVDKDDSDLGIHNHGRLVLSCMAAFSQGKIIGSAPKAMYSLFRTEDAASERLIEEINWVAAAEMADSMGIDIFDTSLGYTRFSNDTGGVDELTSWTWDDLDGNTSYITRGADMAAQKGILVVNSAGNSGSNSWKYIGMPADGDSVLAIGATDSSRWRSGFSSFGRGSDARVKPNVMAQGSYVYVSGLDSNGNSMVGFNFGTSFSSPLTAGAAACLWQANPDLTAWELKSIIEESSTQFNYPDTIHGYGIPDFGKAYELATQQEEFSSKLFPNPSDGIVHLKYFLPENGDLELEIFDISGKKTESKKFFGYKGKNIQSFDFSNLSSGLYLLKLKNVFFQEVLRLELLPKE